MAPATEFLRGRTRLVALLLAAALVACSPIARAQDGRDTVDIGQNTGGPPAHFDFLPAEEGQQHQWTLIENGTAAGGFAIEQRGAAATADHSLAIYKAASLKGAEISLRIKATGGTEDQGGGITVRLATPDNYYLVQLDARRDRVLFSRIANGVSEEIVGVDADLATNEWHRLAVRAAEEELVVSVDGVCMFAAFDKTFLHAGASRFGPAPTASRDSTASRSPLLRRRRSNGDTYNKVPSQEG
jgi:hypothetical protein